MPWVHNTCQLSACQNCTLRQALNEGKHKCPEKSRPETELTQQAEKKIFYVTKNKSINKCLFLSNLKCFYFNGTCSKCWHKSQRRSWLLLPRLVKEEDSLSISTSAHLTLIPMSCCKTSEMHWLYRRRKNSLKINSDGAFGIFRLWPMLRPSLCLKDIHMYNFWPPALPRKWFIYLSLLLGNCHLVFYQEHH